LPQIVFLTCPIRFFVLPLWDMIHLITRVLPRKDKANSNGLCPMVLQVSAGKRLDRIALGFSIKLMDFDFNTGKVKKTFSGYKTYNDRIEACLNKANALKAEMEQLILLFEIDDRVMLFKELFKAESDEAKAAFIKRYNDDFGIQMSSFEMPYKKLFGPRIPLKMSVPIDKYDIAVELIRKLIRGDDDQRIKDAREAILKDADEEGHEEFMNAWNQYLRYCNLEKRPSTYSRLHNFMNILNEYAQSRALVLTFDTFTEDFGMDFKYYLLQEHFNYITNEKGVSNGTLHNIQKSIAAFLNWAFKKGFHNNIDFKRWNTKKPKTDLQYLNEQQLIELREYTLQEGGSLDKSRDLWLFSAYSGLRFGDMQNWSPAFVTNDGVIKYTSQKTRKVCMVGLNNVTKSILKKYDGGLPKQNSSLVNQNIKEILRLMGYDQTLVSRTIAKGNQDHVKTIPLCDAITVHSAKRSFINLMISKKVQIAHLSSMIGNEVKSLMVYYKSDITEMRRVMETIELY